MVERHGCVFCDTYHPDKRCDESVCDAAGPGAPHSTAECRPCLMRLARGPVPPAGDGPKPPAPEPPEKPGLWKQIMHFGMAAVKHARNGFKEVPEGEYRRRLAVCGACPLWVDNVCRACGCAVAGDKVAKARWASETCPQGKW